MTPVSRWLSAVFQWLTGRRRVATVSAASGGIATVGNVIQSTITTGIPADEFRKVREHFESFVEKVADERGIPVDWIRAALKRAGYTDQFPVSAIEPKLNEIVDELAQLRSENDQLRGKRPDLAPYIAQIDYLLQQGELDRAARALEVAWQWNRPSWGARSARSLTARSDEHWIPLTDLMTGLMLIFMLIAVSWAIQNQSEVISAKAAQASAAEAVGRMRSMAVSYVYTKRSILQELQSEFEKELVKWNAELLSDLTIRFKNPDVLFENQRYELRPRFKEILQEFFPRYIRILTQPHYRDLIEEVRIEGHTSSGWAAESSPIKAYLKNMELSQARTRAVLEYVIELKEVMLFQQWIVGRLTANGLSSSRPRPNAQGVEDVDGSRRVEFRIRTNADSRVEELFRVQ